jgi:hypothetical protein
MVNIIDNLYPEEGMTGEVYSQTTQYGLIDIGLTHADEDRA